MTDSVHNKCVFINSSCETILGFGHSDLKDRDLWDMQTVMQAGNNTSDEVNEADKVKVSYNDS